MACPGLPRPSRQARCSLASGCRVRRARSYATHRRGGRRHDSRERDTWSARKAATSSAWSAQRMSQPDRRCQRGRPGVRRAGLTRQSPALTPGQRRRRRRLDIVRRNSAAQRLMSRVQSSAANQGELVVDGITAVELELRPDLSVGAALPPAGRQRPGGVPAGAWHIRVAWATMPGRLVMTAGPGCCGRPCPFWTRSGPQGRSGGCRVAPVVTQVAVGAGHWAAGRRRRALAAWTSAAGYGLVAWGLGTEAPTPAEARQKWNRTSSG